MMELIITPKQNEDADIIAASWVMQNRPKQLTDRSTVFYTAFAGGLKMMRQEAVDYLGEDAVNATIKELRVREVSDD